MPALANHSRNDTLAYLPTADDRVFVERLRAGDRPAIAIVFDRHGAAIERVLERVLGCDTEVPDLLHDVFVQAMLGVSRYRGDSASLRPWLLQIAVRTARKCIRRRTTRRMLGLRTPGELPDAPDAVDPEQQTAVRRAHAALDRLPADERIAFCLRFVEGMQLGEIADACDTSLATVKRRLLRARVRFEQLAAKDSLLGRWIEEVAR